MMCGVWPRSRSRGERGDETLGWESVRVQIESGAIGTVGPRDSAGAFDVKRTLTCKKGLGYVAAMVAAWSTTERRERPGTLIRERASASASSVQTSTKR